jgi:hypothetical protein
MSGMGVPPLVAEILAGEKVVDGAHEFVGLDDRQSSPGAQRGGVDQREIQSYFERERCPPFEL